MAPVARLMRVTAISLVVPLFAGAITLASCRSATEIDVVVTTDFTCDDLKHVTITVGALGAALEDAPPTTVSTECTSDYAGRLVVTPSGDSSELLAVKVIGGFGDAKTAEDCVPTPGSSPPTYGKGCIVARRALRFEPHTKLTVPIILRASCDGVACGETETCVEGSCVSATLPSASCEGTGCGENTLFDGGAPPPIDAGAIDASDASDAMTSTDATDASDAAEAGTPPLVPSSVVAQIPLSVVLPSGLATQVHAAFAENDQRLWYFYMDDQADIIHARVTSDYATWTDAGNISWLGNGSNNGNGANFSVAYVNAGGLDVFHFVVSEYGAGVATTYHVRATLSGAAGSEKLDMSSASHLVQNGNAACAIDGPFTLIGPDGHAYDAVSWVANNLGTECDMNVFRSADVETGTGNWTGTFTQSGYFVTTGFTSSHSLVPLVDAGRVMGAWADDEQGNFDSNTYAGVSIAKDVTGYDGGMGQPISANLFYGDTTHLMSNVDWAICRLGDGDVHAVRHWFDSTMDDGGAPPVTFEEMIFDGTAWQTATPPAQIASFDTAGGVVLTSGRDPAKGMLAFVIGPDGMTIEYAVRTAAGWSPSWTAIPGTAMRTGLSGTGCGSAHPSLFWLEGPATGPHSIVGMDVESLLLP